MKKVGCSPVTVKLKIRNLRCWDIVVNWIVSATGAGEHFTLNGARRYGILEFIDCTIANKYHNTGC
jgi:hypothetical protein